MLKNGILSKSLRSNGYGYIREYDEFEYGTDDHIVFTYTWMMGIHSVVQYFLYYRNEWIM